VKADKNDCNAHALCLFLTMFFTCFSNIYDSGWNSESFDVSRQAETGIILKLLFVYSLAIPHIKVAKNAIWKLAMFAVVCYQIFRRYSIMSPCIK